MPNEIPVVFHDGLSYDYWLSSIIKELTNEFECLGKNKKKYKRFLVPIKKVVTNIDKDGSESVVTISYKIKFIDSARFITRSLSNLVDNLAEAIYKIKCKDGDCFLQCESVKDNLIKYKCLSCYENYSSKVDAELTNWLKNTLKVSNNDINKFILLLRKGGYPYEYMDDWEKFNEPTLPEKEELYSNLLMEDITDADNILAKRVWKDLRNIKIKNFGEYHDLYLKSDALLLTDAFKNSRKMCFKIYHLDPVKCLSALGLAS